MSEMILRLVFNFLLTLSCVFSLQSLLQFSVLNRPLQPWSDFCVFRAVSHAMMWSQLWSIMEKSSRF